METLVKIFYGLSFPAIFFIGLGIRLIIGMRQFNRRGLGGLQHFNNYFAGLIILFMEWALKWAATVLIIWSAWGWWFR